jgi:hypothetical protein
MFGPCSPSAAPAAAAPAPGTLPQAAAAPGCTRLHQAAPGCTTWVMAGVMASRWVDLKDQDVLLDKAASPPWQHDGDYTDGARFRRVEWTPAAAAADAAGDDGGWASHEVAWCRRPEGDIAIHRFQLSPGTSTQDLVRSLETMVREDMRAEKRCDPASNVDGFHGNRDLWLRPEFHELTLPWLIGEAVTQASQFEAEQLGQDPVATTCDESWFNVTGPYGWNQLHTHAGSKVACVFFIADGGCCSTADQLGGRLAFVTNEPSSLPEFQLGQVRRHLHSTGESTGKRRKLASSPSSPQYLLLDPVPGTCVVFPGFLPHFVLPMSASTSDANHASTDTGAAPLRMSIALNFGETDPVLVHMVVRTAPDGEAYVKIFLEIEDDVSGF